MRVGAGGWAALAPCVILLLATTGCQGGPDRQVRRCADAVAIAGHASGKPYDDHDWIGVPFVGPVTTDPVGAISTTAPSGRLDLVPGGDVPIAPYRLVGKGSLRMADGTCAVHVKNLERGRRPPDGLGLTAAQTSSIESGQSELVVVMVGPAAS
ncbi:hypothetical protein AB0J86_09625 [Micromonospora sp. NPDC049559]|uniref:hypothetical protein n=1 Tax=Micromonospora sp. NPDC049559 TaxID=3155923 RepID=UPI0034203D1D